MDTEHSETLKIIEITRARLHELEKKQALFGISTPPEVRLEIRSIEADLAKLATRLRSGSVRSTVREDERAPQSPGLIVIVSAPSRGGIETLVAWEAIDYHRGPLRHCWLIGTGGTNGTMPYVAQLRERCARYNFATYPVEVTNAASIAETYRAVECIYTKKAVALGLNEQDVLADITGGTKPMSIGMALACSPSRPMSYVTVQSDGIAIPMRIREEFGNS